MQRLSYSNVMASIAVFVALGGSAFAATKIGGQQVRDNSLTSKDIKNGTLVNSDVKRDSQTRYLLLDEGGNIVEQSGGFKVISKPGENEQPTTNPNIYVDAGSSLEGHGLGATIAIQNLVDTSGDGTPDPNFAGDAAVGRCASDTINCVPAGTNEDDTLVVRAQVPAQGLGSSASPARVYVTVTP